MKLKDKSAIVTGAASGIGKEIAFRFARVGAGVAIADLDKAAADTVAADGSWSEAVGADNAPNVDPGQGWL